LAEFDPDLYGFCLITNDGQVLKLGDYAEEFPIESCVKPIVYSHAVDLYGYDYVHNWIGREPSGVAFNAFTLNHEKKPHNACINAGAMVTCALYHPEKRPGERYKEIEAYLERLGGNVEVSFNQSVYLSERDTAHTNFALANYMCAKGSFPTKTMSELNESLNFYFQCCSIGVTAEKACRMASTFANFGVNPHTREKICSKNSARRTCQLCFAAGLYDFSGEWASTVGVPGKSGVGGLLYTIITGVGAIAVYSPPLDRNGNSVKAVELTKRIAEKYKWSLFDKS